MCLFLYKQFSNFNLFVFLKTTLLPVFSTSLICYAFDNTYFHCCLFVFSQIKLFSFSKNVFFNTFISSFDLALLQSSRPLQSPRSGRVRHRQRRHQRLLRLRLRSPLLLDAPWEHLLQPGVVFVLIYVKDHFDVGTRNSVRVVMSATNVPPWDRSVALLKRHLHL